MFCERLAQHTQRGMMKNKKLHRPSKDGKLWRLGSPMFIKEEEINKIKYSMQTRISESMRKIIKAEKKDKETEIEKNK